MVNARGVLELPGAEKKNRDTRGERDSRIDACLTLTEFIKIIIHIILNHNSYHHFKDYPFTEEMIRNRVEPYPIELWNWGLQNRIGAPRTLPADVIYKNVLPSDTASITGNGILYEGLYYYCEWADQKDWFVTARKGGRWHETISYDSRLVDVIYLHIDRQGEMQPCTLTEKSDMFVGWSWEEYKLYREDKKMRDSKAKAENYQHRVDTDAQINAIVVPAKKRKQKALEVTPKSRRELLSGKSENRTEERASENANFRIGNVPVPNNTPASVEDKDQPEINAFTPVERPRNIEDLLKKQRQKLDRQEIDTQSEVDNG